MKTAIDLAERGLVPDWITRRGIRRLLRGRLREVCSEEPEVNLERLLRETSHDPVALHTAAANEQHYEVPADFFKLILGPNLKYSACLWTDGIESLGSAEEAMLTLTCERAGLTNGQTVLELGCGWGSLSLWMARHYPDSDITAVSNSESQVDYIRKLAKHRGLGNVRAMVSDMNEFSTDTRFDRVVSVEMFEHMRNLGELLSRVRRWLRPEGQLFVHIFAHRRYAYPFEARGDSDWMSKYFFTGGLMPSEDLLAKFPEHFEIKRQWRVAGTHYAQTLEAWLDQLDARRGAVREVLASTYGDAEAERWVNRWRLFLLACAELFAYRNGDEWGVGHYLMVPSGARS